MPVFIHLGNLVFSKSIIEQKYKGGCAQFRKDLGIDEMEVNQEDDELFCVAASELGIDYLEREGLHYNRPNNISTDFSSVDRYGGAEWEVDWLEYNSSFAWHVHCKPEQREKAKYIGEKATLDEVAEAFDRGINMFATIKSSFN
jgi:hypothetical protein